MTISPHIPVLLNEVIRLLPQGNNLTICDATFGAGGYSKAILKTTKHKVIAVDRDNTVQKYAHQLNEKYPDRFQFVLDNFANITQILTKLNVSKIDTLLLDLGVSSMQLDNPQRGFSFCQNAMLDMRMNQNDKVSAFDVINSLSQKELADIIYLYGDERKSRIIAKKIVQARKQNKITNTKQLTDIVDSVYPNGRRKIHPATKTFQAIRIFVNDEIKQLKQILQQVPNILNKKGRAMIVSFHSGEDKIIKNFFKQQSGLKIDNHKYNVLQKYLPIDEINNTHNIPKQKNKQNNTEVTLKLVNKKPIVPQKTELIDNIRARSAKLRAAERI